jgi:ubiquinone/menaquinone biosynthesis C-methylase UbiE
MHVDQMDDVVNRADVDATYLHYQYGDSEKLRIRSDTHRLYSARPDRLRERILSELTLAPGLLVLDVGCGPGGYHEPISRTGARVVGVDTSAGMVREARSGAVAYLRPVAVAQADAQALPFRSRVFDRVLSAHILYHVPDRVAALVEMRRVLAAGGRVVIATNGASFLARLDQLHQAAATSLGYVPTTGDGNRFTLDDLSLVRTVFPSAERHVQDNSLRFHHAEPVLRYYASGVVDRIQDRPTDGSHRARLLPLVQDGVEAILRREGVFDDPKPAGWFTANVTQG